MLSYDMMFSFCVLYLHAIPLFIIDFCRFSLKPSHLFTARGPFALAIKKRARDSSVDYHIPGSE